VGRIVHITYPPLNLEAFQCFPILEHLRWVTLMYDGVSSMSHYVLFHFFIPSMSHTDHMLNKYWPLATPIMCLANIRPSHPPFYLEFFQLFLGQPCIYALKKWSIVSFCSSLVSVPIGHIMILTLCWSQGDSFSIVSVASSLKFNTFILCVWLRGLCPLYSSLSSVHWMFLTGSTSDNYLPFESHTIDSLMIQLLIPSA